MLFLLASDLDCASQDIGGIMTITGAGGEEELTDQDMERFESYLSSPLEINMSSVAALMKSGLFSVYQAVSVADYRSRHGDILSLAELAAVDGIGEAYADALAPYVSFYSSSLPGSLPRPGVKSSSMARMVLRNGSADFRGKYRITSRRVEAGMAVRKDSPANGSAYVSIKGRKHLESIVVGDFNARFGQGLSIWTGMTMSGIGAPSSMYKRQYGIYPAWTFSDAHFRGAASSFSFGRVIASSFVSYPGMTFLQAKDRDFTGGVNLAVLTGNGRAGVTAVGGTGGFARISGDMRLCIKGVELFAEGAFDIVNSASAFLAGAVVPLGEGTAGVVGRLYQTAFDPVLTAPVRAWTKACDETGVAASWQRKDLVLGCDLAAKPSTRGTAEPQAQVKLLCSDAWNVSRSVVLKARLTHRLRSYGLRGRTDARADVCVSSGRWLFNARANVLRCRNTSWLGYLEPG
ncbi:MAG: helix-hairpin-helix domain-containing protein [Candidatus Cryptobacteroides sp.]